VRRQATDFFDTTTVSPPPTFKTEIVDATSRRGRAQAPAEAREKMLFSQTRFASPEGLFVCDGWCKYSEEPHPNVVSIENRLWRDNGLHACRQLSLSACSDLQRAWEGPKGSLTTMLCDYLSKCMLYIALISRPDRSYQRSTVAHHTVP
jgi:hypothetical protein